MDRVKSRLFVQSILRLADTSGRPGAVLRSGDPDAGGILAVLRGRAGLVVLSQVRTSEGDPAWMRGTGAEPADQATVDAYLDRQVRRDPDLWVVEFDCPDLQPPFAAKLI